MQRRVIAGREHVLAVSQDDAGLADFLVPDDDNRVPALFDAHDPSNALPSFKSTIRF
jgi:hypothetical protein